MIIDNPQLLAEALPSIECVREVKAATGEQVHNSFIQYKIDEWERYHQTMTDWEATEYLRLY